MGILVLILLVVVLINIQKFNNADYFIHTIKTRLKYGSEEDKLEAKYCFYDMSKICSDYEGNYFVLDHNSRHSVVRKYTKNFIFVDSIGRKGQGPGEYIFPYDQCIDRNNNLYIADIINAKIVIFNKNGHFVCQIPIQPNNKYSIAVDSRNMIYVNGNTYDSLITVYDKNGRFIKKFGQYITNNNSLNETIIKIDNNDNIWVAFTTQPIIRKYSSDGNMLLQKELDSPVINKLKKMEDEDTRTGKAVLYYLTDMACYSNKLLIANRSCIIEYDISADKTVNIYNIDNEVNKPDNNNDVYTLSYNMLNKNICYFSRFKGKLYSTEKIIL